jgi:citrate synthase
MSSLKGPKHGGANLKVMDMMDDIRKHVSDLEDEDELAKYLNRILDKKAFDHQGLIYGMGHAIYTLSDPRAVILKDAARKLAEAKGLEEEFGLYESVEKISSKLLTERKKLSKPICCNVDFYSGFVYSMMGIPRQLYTPIFAIARISGWAAHRMEGLINEGKLIRPAYKYVGHHRAYRKLEDR